MGKAICPGLRLALFIFGALFSQAVEENVDLDSLGKEEEKPASEPSRPGGSQLQAVAAVDFTVEYFQGEKRDEFTFGANHEYLVLGLRPNKRTSFLVEIVSLVYWEFNYAFTPATRLKLGKIAIPFGPLFLHPLLGAAVGKPAEGGAEIGLLTPVEWSEYGIQLDRRMVDRFAYSLETRFWISNGLSGDAVVERQTVDVTGGAGKKRDNNMDKATGFRAENRFFGKYGLNLSFYTCKWEADDPERGDEEFYEGDRLFLGNVDFEIGYAVFPVPVLKNTRFRGEYALMRTHSTARTALSDKRVPWHSKSADMVEVMYTGLHRYADIRFRAGRYDDNTDVLNSRDLINCNLALIFELTRGVHIIPMYMWNREEVNEKRDDLFFVKLFIEL